MERKITNGARLIRMGGDYLEYEQSPADTSPEGISALFADCRNTLKRAEGWSLLLQYQETLARIEESTDRIEGIDFWEVEVPDDQRRLAERVVKYCAADLRMKHPGAIRLLFYEPEPDKAKAYAARYTRDWKHFRHKRTTAGIAEMERLNAWIRADMEGADLVEVAAHETYHLANPAASEDETLAYGKRIARSFN